MIKDNKIYIYDKPENSNKNGSENIPLKINNKKIKVKKEKLKKIV